MDLGETSIFYTLYTHYWIKFNSPESSILICQFYWERTEFRKFRHFPKVTQFARDKELGADPWSGWPPSASSLIKQHHSARELGFCSSGNICIPEHTSRFPVFLWAHLSLLNGRSSEQPYVILFHLFRHPGRRYYWHHSVPRKLVLKRPECLIQGHTAGLLSPNFVLLIILFGSFKKLRAPFEQQSL